MTQNLSHLNQQGEVHMVDVGDRPVSNREAHARGAIRMDASTLGLIQRGETPKGDLLAVARVAAIQAAKRTWELIPLCHPLPLSGVDVTIDADASLPGLVVHSRCRTTGQTGVEMEAMTAVSVGLLTLYDMLKAVDPAMTIEAIQLEFKDLPGGKLVCTWMAKMIFQLQESVGMKLLPMLGIRVTFFHRCFIGQKLHIHLMKLDHRLLLDFLNSVIFHKKVLKKWGKGVDHIAIMIWQGMLESGFGIFLGAED